MNRSVDGAQSLMKEAGFEAGRVFGVALANLSVDADRGEIVAVIVLE
jgi:hypothetical protein